VNAAVPHTLLVAGEVGLVELLIVGISVFKLAGRRGGWWPFAAAAAVAVIGAFAMYQHLGHRPWVPAAAAGVSVAVAAFATYLAVRLRRLIGRPVQPPDHHGRVVPGQIWWADVPFEERRETKDRPCVVLRSSDRRLTVLMVTSQDRSRRKDYLRLPAGQFRRPQGHDSWIRLDRRIQLQRSQLRRLEGHVDPETWRGIRRRHRDAG
jgi:mRNA-degrading endonuclease toxin of MazEF toxin-antitoxin module